MGTAVTVDLSIHPDKVEEFLELIRAIAPDTRAFAGCRHFDIWRDQDQPGHILFYEIWDSRADQEKYLAWRTETGVMDQLVPFVAAPPVFAYYDLFDG